MAVIDRHRVARLMELSAAERTLRGPERLLREEDVAHLIKAAYDDANEKARADFMARIQRAPTSAWPWSAVQVVTSRGGGGGGLAVPSLTIPPPALLLLLGQVDTPDADPANRIPDRDTPEGAAWEPLHKALAAWDTATIKKWWHPVGWVEPGQSALKQEGFDPSGKDAGPQNPTPSSAPVVPATTAPAEPPTTWTPPRIALVAGATLVTSGIVLYSAMSLARAREIERLSARLRRQEDEP